MLPIVVGISGHSGCGKTSTAIVLKKYLQATVVHMDSFTTELQGYPSVAEWIRAGGDCNRWVTTNLADTIAQVISSASENGFQFVIVDDTFGRSRDDISALIDHSFYLDVSLDVAFARKISRLTEDANATTHDVRECIKRFINGGQQTELRVSKCARLLSDTIISAWDPTEVIARSILENLVFRIDGS